MRARTSSSARTEHSVVADAVRAVEYDALPPLTTFYYSYFSGFDADDIEQYVRDYNAVGCFPTNDGLTLIVVVWPSSRFNEVRTDIEGHVRNVHESIPSIADRMRRAKREDRWFGTAGVANHFRKPYGPGWALVGDAGYQKDPLTAQGISDAFIDAGQLADALDAGFSGCQSLDEALTAYHASRDARAKPMYFFTCELARLEPPPPPLQAFMNPANIERIVAG